MNQNPTKSSESSPTKTTEKTLEIIRSELNLEQWSIWQPSSSNNAPKARVLTREVTLPDGSTATAKVEVGFTHKGGLTTEDQKTLYALTKQWEERGRSDALTPFSLKRLAKILGKKWGTQTVTGLVNSLTRLRATPFTWTYSFFDSTTGETVEFLDTFNILSDLRIAKRSKGGSVTMEAGYFKFHDPLLANLLNNHTKPVLYEVAIGFRSEIAQLLYGRLDRFMVDKTQYERRTKEMFEDLGLEGKEYNKPSVRKRLLERALTELTGKPLTTGSIKSATIEQTKDKKDYKAVVRKGARADKILRASQDKGERELPQPAALTDDAKEMRAKGTDLVKYFYLVFHGSDKTNVTSKAADQAVSLIAQYGYEQAKYVIDYAHRAAPETNYKPQSFGGILQYGARAVAEYEEYRNREQDRDVRQAEEVERRRLEEAHAAYWTQAVDAYMTEQKENLPAWLEAKKKDLLREKPDFYLKWDDDALTKYALRMVRYDTAHQLNLLSFNDYYEQHRTRQDVTSSPDQINN